MRISIISFTYRGYVLGENIKEKLGSCHKVNTYTTNVRGLEAGIARPIVGGLMAWSGEQFMEQEGLIFIGAAGIAVRAIAPFLKDKMLDPAVIVADEYGEHIISLLSGHVGKGNRLATEIAEGVKGEAVITTATDKNKLWAVDVFATENGLWISDRKKAKQISADLLEGERIQLYCENIRGNVPKELELVKNHKADVMVSWKGDLRDEGLYLIPKVIFVGIGCKKGTDFEAVDLFLQDTLKEKNIFIESIGGFASIDLKEKEEGLVQLSKKYQIPFLTYSNETLNKVEGKFTGSKFVQEVTGVDNVCERSAVLATDDGILIQKKICHSGITLALAVKKWGVYFE